MGKITNKELFKEIVIADMELMQHLLTEPETGAGMTDTKKCPKDADHQEVEIQCGAISEDGYKCTRDSGHEKIDNKGHHAHITER